ncbi:MAG: hypothetical protein Q9191_005738, partial [Dirinaria sp. TL-2023a]
VYSPHTAIDAAPGGLGDWLADIVTGTLGEPEPATKTAEPQKQEPPQTRDETKPPQRPGGGLQRSYSRPHYPAPEKLEQTELTP